MTTLKHVFLTNSQIISYLWHTFRLLNVLKIVLKKKKTKKNHAIKLIRLFFTTQNPKLEHS